MASMPRKISRSTSASTASSVSSSSWTGAPARKAPLIVVDVAGVVVRVGTVVPRGEKGVVVREKVNAVGPRDSARGWVLVGTEVNGEVPVSSAPDQRKPSKRPEIRMSHSGALMAAIVAKALCRLGFLRRYMAVSGCRGGFDRR